MTLITHWLPPLGFSLSGFSGETVDNIQYNAVRCARQSESKMCMIDLNRENMHNIRLSGDKRMAHLVQMLGISNASGTSSACLLPDIFDAAQRLHKDSVEIPT